MQQEERDERAEGPELDLVAVGRAEHRKLLHGTAGVEAAQQFRDLVDDE
ncbi:hypothetical protein [Kutzneria sp. 744]|nr:hypothetical protein [Kutzneria sp. 744]